MTLTRDEIVNEPPGPRLNAWVAVVVFGWQQLDSRPAHWPPLYSLVRRHDKTVVPPYMGPWYLPPGLDVINGVQPPDYSGDVGEAWQIALQYRKWSGRAAFYTDGHSLDYADCAIRDGTYMAYGDCQVAEAMCKAALLERLGHKHPRHYR